MSRHRSHLIVTALVIALSVPVAAEPKPEFATDRPETITISAKPIARFSRSDATATKFGKLEFRGGLVLSSNSPKFGGWSALEIDPDGRRILAISDVGLWMTARLAYDNGRVSGVEDALVGPILGVGGAPLMRPRDRDLEGVTLLDGTLTKGSVLISFEVNHRIGRFPITANGLGPPTGYLPLPPEAQRQRRNQSLESVCVMRAGPNKGSVVTLSERFPDRTETRHTGWMSNRGLPANSGAWTTLTIHNIGGYDLTDCRGLPDGSLLVLERRFRWSSWYEGVKMRLRQFSASELAGGGLLEGDVLIEADLGNEIDNMEGLAAHRTSSGETIVTMISDNNFNNFLQRTVLLQFALPAADQARQAKAAAPR